MRPHCSLAAPRLAALAAFLTVAGLTGCAIFGNSQKDRELFDYRERATLYYDTGKFDQAEDQVRRGLEIDDRDYKLNELRGWIWTQKARRDPVYFDVAKRQHEKTLSLRTDAPRALLGFGLCSFELARFRFAEAERLEQEAASGLFSMPEAEQRKAAAAEFRRKAEAELIAADHHLSRLIEIGDQVLLARFHLLGVTIYRRQFDRTRDNCDELLKIIATRRASLEARTDKTYDVAAENNLRASLRDLRDKEITVRSTLANLDHDAKNFRTAIEHLDRILELDPQRPVDYFNRGRCYFGLNMFTHAKADIETFLRRTDLPFDSPHVREAHDIRHRIDKELRQVTRRDDG
jgi:tetratricopeptide (TPR) repeat protein